MRTWAKALGSNLMFRPDEPASSRPAPSIMMPPVMFVVPSSEMTGAAGIVFAPSRSV